MDNSKVTYGKVEYIELIKQCGYAGQMDDSLLRWTSDSISLLEKGTELKSWLFLKCFA